MQVLVHSVKVSVNAFNASMVKIRQLEHVYLKLLVWVPVVNAQICVNIVIWDIAGNVLRGISLIMAHVLKTASPSILGKVNV